VLNLSPFELQTILVAVQKTVTVAFFAILLALPIGIAAGIARRSRFRLLRIVTGIYVEVFRGTSALVQLFVAIFVLPSFGFTLDPMITATLVLALNGGAYAAESARGALQAVPKGQIEAAQALRLGWWTTNVSIVLPQAWRIMIPSFGNVAIDLLKGTSLLSLVAIAEVSLTISNLNMSGAIDSTTAYIGLFVVYLVLSIPVMLVFAWLERRSARKLGRMDTR
jgi:polar amino acid transport system permease protein